MLLADGRLSDAAAAAEAGVSTRVIYYWMLNEEFSARVQFYLAKLQESIITTGVAVKELRVRRLNEDWQRIQQIRAERAADPQMDGVPGASTGWLVRDMKGVGKGEDYQMVDLYSADTGLMAELRNIEKQAAQELGQWDEGNPTVRVMKAYYGFDPEAV